MAFFSFFLFTETITHLSEKIEPNQKYYSKDITLWKQLNNQNKKKQLLKLKIEKRLKINKIGKKILFCLPPRFGLGDAIEYANAIKSIIKSGRYSLIGIAFCGEYSIIFKNYFLFTHTYSKFISDKEFNNYDTIFHITLEIEALKYQKYQRSDIALEICKYFQVPLCYYNFKEIYNTDIDKKTISIFPISTSVIRNLPYDIIEQIVKYLL